MFKNTFSQVPFKSSKYMGTSSSQLGDGGLSSKTCVLFRETDLICNTTLPGGTSALEENNGVH